ncbi:double-strand break repair helicase AddA [Lichenibacterium minor]|uniref:double-strand break repair helicase AddA n=1 Tax=Lichenibacterium minor TaxID=2316528 RepID=UPI001FE1BFED|nr:double-strand break repair helicase AddA [Lichenibacterium minor]
MSGQGIAKADAVPAIPSDTIERQRRASHPGTSAWVSANAGSGKTHVLAQRVLRLLLAGVAPSRILCLTFTKAAAANMSIRVFRDLARWTRLDDDGLRRAIADTGAPVPALAGGPAALDDARRLFARTVETPGGLKIQTIHAFCERLLHLFPFEANVPARFEVLDDLRAADLLLRAREAVLADALGAPASGLGRGLATLTGQVSSSTFEALIDEALHHRHLVRDAVRDARDVDGLERALRASLGLGPSDTPAAIEAEMVEGGIPWSDWAEIARSIGADGGGPGKAGNRLMAAFDAPAGAQAEPYLDVFLTAKREPRAPSYLPQALRKKEPALCETLDAEGRRLVGLLGRRKSAETAERTGALMAVASAILDRYDAAKRRRGLLDFEDLVERTRNLLATSSSAWVLYKLDKGIDHILVDEAQDTSPEQWEILRAVSDDFFAGAGRPGPTRTFFAVGDEKQSIYSFQGARPDMFDEMRSYFKERAEDAEQRFAGVDLILSFRSSEAVLRAVDRVFAHAPNGRGLTHDPAGPQPHQALRRAPGRVELWPPVTAVAQPEPGDWKLPVDVVEPGDPPVVVARRIADTIHRLCRPGSGETVAEGNGRRPVRPGDVMILVRSRNSFFEAMIRACKERGVPVAGADRLALTQHIAVMDLVAAGRAALSPADDFTLACVLKSPLLGLDDDDLIALAPGRRGTLMSALGASDAPRHRDAHRKIAAWRDASAWLTPFAFYTRMLGADGGRRDLLGRLGPEAGDAIDEFLALTLAHERDGAPSLMAFLARLDGADLSIKRDMEAAGDAVRVMTVHAAKGLEAKIVFLPDTCAVPSGRHDPSLFGLDERPGEPESGLIAWSPRTDADAAPVAEARALARRRAVEEHNRLLYVAMTRAEERLYVAGFCGEKGPGDGCWYAMIQAAELPMEPAPAPWDPADEILQMRDPDPEEIATAPAAHPASADGTAPDLPVWLFRRPVAEAEPDLPPVRPSNPLGAADQNGPPAWPYVDRTRSGTRKQAAAAGRLMHRLLQHLPGVPAARRAATAARFLAVQGAALDEDHRAALAAQALAVLDDPALAGLFGPDSRAEVAVTASVGLPSGRRIDVTGQIDRIGVTDAAVHIADFKTGAPGAMTPKQALQLALYRAAVEPLYPDHRIRTHLVWTASGEVVEVSAGECANALETMG